MTQTKGIKTSAELFTEITKEGIGDEITDKRHLLTIVDYIDRIIRDTTTRTFEEIRVRLEKDKCCPICYRKIKGKGK